jgi:hypothetical protein
MLFMYFMATTFPEFACWIRAAVSSVAVNWAKCYMNLNTRKYDNCHATEDILIEYV